ncbi:hypothetical protein GW17_00026182 [Ensete ventricosum]|nr:hypothetical protein GW17_00026182 [Ensete ventricosum]
MEVKKSISCSLLLMIMLLLASGEQKWIKWFLQMGRTPTGNKHFHGLCFSDHKCHESCSAHWLLLWILLSLI